jgi:DNA-binding FrmR family transcriptional regulator
VLKQTYAIRRAIEKMESKMLNGHLHHCVVDGIERGDTGVLDELSELYELANK